MWKPPIHINTRNTLKCLFSNILLLLQLLLLLLLLLLSGLQWNSLVEFIDMHIVYALPICGRKAVFLITGLPICDGNTSIANPVYYLLNILLLGAV